MIYENFEFLSADKKTRIHAVRWLPDTRVYSAILQITHGMHEYIERYQDFAGFLADKGFMVVGHDHLGHGASVRTPFEYGFFDENSPSDVLIEDMHTLRTLVQKENKNVPYFMLGHSMGSYMLRKYITIYPKNLRGVILVGTGTMADATVKLGMMLCSVLAKLRGWHHKSRMVRMLSFGGAYRKYDVIGKVIENNWLTKDLEIAEKHYTDPKSRFDFTLNGYYGLLEAIYYDNQKQNIEKIPRKLPIFLVSGDKDPVGDMGEGVKKVYHQYEKAGLLDITWKLYKDDRHEILNELDREVVFEDIYAFMCVRKTT